MVFIHRLNLDREYFSALPSRSKKKRANKNKNDDVYQNVLGKIYPA